MIVSDNAEMYIDYYESLVKYEQIPKYYGKYLEHVLDHKDMVFLAWIYIGDQLCELDFINEQDMQDINKLIVEHDDSKLESEEFGPYAKRFNGPRKKDPIVKANFKEAVKLHKQRNLHHYEALKNYKGKNWKQYAVELICDYIAMGWEFKDYICEYFDRVKDEIKNELPEQYYNYIESIIKIIPEKFGFAEKPLTENNIGYIYYCYNNYNDPWENDDFEEPTEGKSPKTIT